MNRLKSQYMQSSLFSAEQQPYYINEFTPFQGITFLSDDYEKDQVKIQPGRPFSNEISNALQPSAQYQQRRQQNINRLRGSVAKSSKLQAMISLQAGGSLAMGATSQKLSALSLRAATVGLTQERARYDKEKEAERAGGGRAAGQKTKRKKEEVDEAEILQILQPTEGKGGKAKMEEGKTEGQNGQQRLSALAKTMKIKRALEEQTQLQTKASLLQDTDKLKEKLADFYASVNMKKTDEFLGTAAAHIQEHGFGAFQEKLVAKYGRGLEFDLDQEENTGKKEEDGEDARVVSSESLGEAAFRSLGIGEVDPSKLRRQIEGFYKSIADSKDPSFIDNVMLQIEHNGVEKFNEGLKAKYGVDLDSPEAALGKVREENEAKKPQKPRGNIFSSILSGRFGAQTAGMTAEMRESLESIEEPQKSPPRAGIFSGILGRGGNGKTAKNEEARKPNRIAAVFGNLINFRPGRRSVAFTGKTNQATAVTLEATAGPRDSNSTFPRDEEEKAEEPSQERQSGKERPKTLVTLQEQLDLVDQQIREINTKIETQGPTVQMRQQLSQLEAEKKELRYRIGVKNVEILI